MFAPLVRPVTLEASNVTASGATLNIANHTGGWWYKGGKLSGTAGSCTSVASGTSTATLSGLEADTPYEYKAYSKANCASGRPYRYGEVHYPQASGSWAHLQRHQRDQQRGDAHPAQTAPATWWYKDGSRSGGRRQLHRRPVELRLEPVRPGRKHRVHLPGLQRQQLRHANNLYHLQDTELRHYCRQD